MCACWDGSEVGCLFFPHVIAACGCCWESRAATGLLGLCVSSLAIKDFTVLDLDFLVGNHYYNFLLYFCHLERGGKG